MCVMRTVLVAVLLVAVASGARGVQSRPILELGDLRAVPGSGPAFVFQLPIFRQAHAPLDMPTIVVRHPRDVLFFVGNNTLELRMLDLADVELEISYAGQTVHRLLLKTELQAARARMQSDIARNRSQEAKTRDVKGTRRERVSKKTPWAQQDVTPLTPDAVMDQRRGVASERTPLTEQRIRHEESVRLEGISRTRTEGETSAVENRMAALEREMGSIREGIQALVGHVATVRDVSNMGRVRHHNPQQTFNPLLAVTLGGLLVAGVASLLTGYAMRHRALYCERERHRALATAMPHEVALQPLTPVIRRIRISYKTTRRVHLRETSGREPVPPLMPLERAPLALPDPPPAISETSDLDMMLAHLRQELIRVQMRYLTQSAQVKHLRALLAKLTDMAKET